MERVRSAHLGDLKIKTQMEVSLLVDVCACVCSVCVCGFIDDERPRVLALVSLRFFLWLYTYINNNNKLINNNDSNVSCSS